MLHRVIVIIAGFEEIERFVEEHSRAPEHCESRDIFERLYAVRTGPFRRVAWIAAVAHFDVANSLSVQ